MEFNFEVLEMQKWNIPTDRTQRVDEKNGVIICLVIMLTPRVSWSLKCENWVNFCIFCWWQQRISKSLGKTFKLIWKILFTSFRIFCGLLGSELPLARCQLLKIQFLFFFFDPAVLLYFYPQYLTYGNSKAY